MDFFNKLKKLDAYPKTQEDFRIRTASGAIVSIVTGLFIVFLFFGEFNYYLTMNVSNELSVDLTKEEKLRINMDIIFQKMPCLYLSLDAMDISGSTQLDVVHNIYKKRLDERGNPVGAGQKQTSLGGGNEEKVADSVEKKKDENYCGPCYGSESEDIKCCNTCDDVREAYRRKGWAFNNADGIEQCVNEGFTKNIEEQANEGCNVFGYLEVSKVAGNFHFAPGKSFTQSNMHIHDLMPYKSSHFNFSHTIRRLSFGEDFPGIINPLDGVSQFPPITATGPSMYQYFVKVVPTVYEYLDGSLLKTNQFSVTDHYKELEADGSNGLPGVFFMYDLSPIMVRFVEKQRSLSHFLTSVCAIVGGVFTVASLLDSFIHASIQRFKNSIGKSI